MKLPDHVGIMTLPNAVLFPGTLLPLYIFEDRYRRLLADALEGDRIFAVGLEHQADQPHDVAGVGLIRSCQGNADGTSHLVLQGLARVRICAFSSGVDDVIDGLDYPSATIEPLSSNEDDDPADRLPVVGAVRKLARARARLGAKLPKGVVASLTELENNGLFADVVSATFLESFQEKQLLLETLDVGQRLVLLEELLRKQTDQLALWKKLQGKIRNKDVGYN